MNSHIAGFCFVCGVAVTLGALLLIQKVRER